MNYDQDPAVLLESYPAAYRSLRLALVTETYPPEVNGVAITLQRLVQGLRANNHHIQLVRPRQTVDREAAIQDGFAPLLTKGFPIPKYPHLRLGAPARKLLMANWQVNRPDLVHIATEGPLGWSALKVARKLKLPVTSDFRTNFDTYSRHYGMAWLKKPIGAYLRRFHNLCDATMVPTAKLRDELSQRDFERLQVVARGVDTALFNPTKRSAELRQSWGVQDNQPVALSVGRLATEKNLPLLVQAAHAMRNANPDVALVVVGDGPARQGFAQQCPFAIMAGFQTGEALAQHYASADIFLFPSLSETFGNVTLEAAASGLAISAFDYAAASELIVHADNGLVAAIDKPQDFINNAIELATDTALRHKLRSNANASTQRMAWEAIVDQVQDVWLDLLRTPHTSPTQRVDTKTGFATAPQA